MQKMLKMEYIRGTSHDSKIYAIEGQKFINTMKKLKERI